jgi:hypothetical protein
MRILVCGGRGYSDRHALYRTLDRLYAKTPVTLLIHGGAHGADALAAAWAKTRTIPVDPYPADWADVSHRDAIIKYSSSGRRYDARAGFRRNQLMIDRGRPDLVVAFPGGSGTRDMVARAQAAGIRVVTV